MTTLQNYKEIQILNPLERVTCTRCGGSGSYSYCSAYGTKCFKCSGKGKVLTKRGCIAVEYINSLRIKTIQAIDVQVGEFIHTSSIFGLSSKYRKVLTKEIKDNSVSFSVEGTEFTFGFEPTSKVKVMSDNVSDIDSWMDGIALQNSLSKTGKPTKLTSQPHKDWINLQK